MRIPSCGEGFIEAQEHFKTEGGTENISYVLAQNCQASASTKKF